MATNNVVDTLEIEIQASAKGAIESLGKLEGKLRKLSSTTSNLANQVHSIRSLSGALKDFGTVKISTAGLTRLSKIKMDPANVQNVNSMAKAVSSLNGINFKGVSFTPLINGLEKLSKIYIPSDYGTKFQQVANGLSALGNVNFKDVSFTPVVNAISKLSEINIDPVSLMNLARAAQTLGTFSQIPDVSASVNKLISALAKLASTGRSISLVSMELPNFATAIRKVATILSQLGGVSPEVISFVSALAKLTSLGDKIPDAAKNLDELTNALTKMIQSIGNKSINQDVVQLTQSIAQLAQAMSKIGGRTGQDVTTQTTSMGKALQKLGNIASNVMRKVVSLFKKVGSGIASISKTIIGNITGIGKASNTMFTVSDGIKSVIGGLLGMKGITGAFNWLKDAVNAGGDITEINHIIETVFEKDMVESVNAWANEAISKFGIAAGAAKSYAGTLSSMFQASGVARREAGEMAMDLVGLAGDLSAFYNIDTQTAYEKLKSGMAGMVRPLRDLGIDLSVATLNEYALSQGIGKTVTQMTQAEKVMLRYQYLLSVTGIQQGDFARTSDSFANVLRTVRAYAAALSTTIGVGLAAAFRHVLILLRSVLKGLLQLANAFSTVMQKIFGQYNGGAKGVSLDLADAADDASGGLGDAADSAEKLKKELSVLPFDELNQLNKDRESTSTGGNGTGGSGSGTGGLGDIGNLDGMMDSLEDIIEDSSIPGLIDKWIERIKESFNKGNWKQLGADIAGMFNEGIQGLYNILDPENVTQKVEPYIIAFTTTFNSLVDNLNFELLGQTVARGINDVVYLFNTWYERMGFENLGMQLSNGLNGLLTEGDFIAWGQALGNKFMIAWDIFKGFVSNEEMWHNLGLALADGLTGLNNGIRLSDIGTALANLANGLCDALADFAENAPWDDVVNNITGGINKFIEKFEWTENGEKIDKFIEKLVDAFVQFVGKTNWEGLGEGIANMLSGVQWGRHLIRVGEAVISALAGILKGLISNPEGRVALAVVGGFAALNIGAKLFGVFSTGSVGSSIAGGIASSLGLSLPAFGAMAAAGIVQSILVAAAWDDIPSTFNGRILPNLEKFGTAMMSPGSVWKSLLLNGFESLFGIEIPDAIETAISYGFVNPIATAVTILRSIVDKTKDEKIPEGIDGEIGRTPSLLQATANHSMALFGTSFSTGYDSNVKPVVQRMAEEIKSRFNTTEQEAATSGQQTAWRYGNGFHNTSELNSGLTGIHSMVQSKVAQIQSEAAIYGDNTAVGYGRAFANQAELSSNLNNTQSLTSTAFTAIQKAAESIGNNTKKGVLHGLKTHLTGLEDTTGAMMSQVQTTSQKVQDAMRIDLSGAGRDAAQSFANGFRAVHIPVPHIYTAGYDTFYFGNGGFSSVPYFGVQWYKAGGLFSGGKGQIIGVGEDNRDEAVLPLENRRAMSRIAESIVNSSAGSGIGISKNDIIEAAAQAIIMTQGSQTAPIFYLEVKTENDEVLARAVTRGQRSIDYRNNPTPQMAY